MDRTVATGLSMAVGAPLILSGRLAHEDLCGEPDLLRREGRGYVACGLGAGDGIADRAGVSGQVLDRRRAVRLAFHADLLERIGMASGRTVEILNAAGRSRSIELDGRRGGRTPSTWWTLYVETLEAVRAIQADPATATPAQSGQCGLCRWRLRCEAELDASDDLTLIPGLGRTMRDRLRPLAETVAQLAAVTPATIASRRIDLAGVGRNRLELFVARARLLSTPGASPYLRDAVSLPEPKLEIFMDVEDDPLRGGIAFLHGFLERRHGDPATDVYTASFADSSDRRSERRAFQEAVAFLSARPDATIYHYARHERTTYRRLQRRFPDVCAAEFVEALFDPARSIDLYSDIVVRATEWPTRNHSIKTLARYLGFAWRDPDPTGVGAVERYHLWTETSDPAVRQRILDYNEDDCRAVSVVLTAIRDLVRSRAPAPGLPPR